MSDTRAAGIGVTIKYGKEYDKTWATFQGDAIAVYDQLLTYFGLENEGLTLNELVINCTEMAHGTTRAVTAFKGTVVKGHKSTPDEAQQPSGEEQATPETTTEDPYAILTQQIKAENISVDTLRRLYADNTEMFTADTDEAKALKALWKARGKELQQKA